MRALQIVWKCTRRTTLGIPCPGRVSTRCVLCCRWEDESQNKKLKKKLRDATSVSATRKHAVRDHLYHTSSIHHPSMLVRSRIGRCAALLASCPAAMRVELIGNFKPCMTDIHINI